VSGKAHNLRLKRTATGRLTAPPSSTPSVAMPMTGLRGRSWLRETRTRIERARTR
jgi:hypothetical protein